MRVNPSTTNQVPAKSSDVSGAQAGKTEKAAATQASKRADKASSVGESGGARGGASAEISGRAKEMAQAKAAATDAPDVREEKIAALKARIASGSYRVDADAIADRMVDEHVRMSGIG